MDVMQAGISDAARKQWEADMKPQPLRRELRTRVFDFSMGGRMAKKLHSKFVIDVPYHEAMNGMHNRMHKERKRFYKIALANREWASALAIIERPYRIAELDRMIRKEPLFTLEDAVALTPDTWRDTEDPTGQTKLWSRVFHHLRNNGVDLVHDDAKQAAKVRSAVKPFKVYRGFRDDEHLHGWSWTVSPKKAAWFARRYRGDGMVATAEVDPGRIVGVMWGRGEQEYVVFPKTAGVIRVQPVDAFAALTTA